MLEPGGPGLASYQYLPELSLGEGTRSVVMTGQTQGEHTGDTNINTRVSYKQTLKTYKMKVKHLDEGKRNVLNSG